MDIPGQYPGVEQGVAIVIDTVPGSEGQGVSHRPTEEGEEKQDKQMEAQRRLWPTHSAASRWEFRLSG